MRWCLEIVCQVFLAIAWKVEGFFFVCLLAFLAFKMKHRKTAYQDWFLSYMWTDTAPFSLMPVMLAEKSKSHLPSLPLTVPPVSFPSQEVPIGFVVCCSSWSGRFPQRTDLHGSSRWGTGSPVSPVAQSMWKWVSGKFSCSSCPASVSSTEGVPVGQKQSVSLPRPHAPYWG